MNEKNYRDTNITFSLVTNLVVLKIIIFQYIQAEVPIYANVKQKANSMKILRIKNMFHNAV